jgi:DNA-binding transcriptional ArsR family regulator
MKTTKKKNSEPVVKKNGVEIELDELKSSIKTIKSATYVIRVVDNKFRQQIISALIELGECMVKEIYLHLGMQQEVCSVHLKTLRSIGVVNSRREQKWIYYSLNRENLKILIDNAAKVAEQTKYAVSKK